MELDRQYIDQWSLSLDVKILARTIPAVLEGVTLDRDATGEMRPELPLSFHGLLFLKLGCI